MAKKRQSHVIHISFLLLSAISYFLKVPPTFHLLLIFLFVFFCNVETQAHKMTKRSMLYQLTKFIVLNCCLCSLCDVANANPDAKRLYDDLLSHYNRLIRPVSNNTEVVTVRLGLRLSQLIDLVRFGSFYSHFFSIFSVVALIYSVLSSVRLKPAVNFNRFPLD